MWVMITAQKLDLFAKKLGRLLELLTSVSIVFAGHEANMVAHLCAKQASIDRKRCTWTNYNPGFLVDTLWSACNPIMEKFCCVLLT
jgi:hypothetical protein